MANELLRLHGISKSFGPTVALQEVDFDVRAGEVHALLGQNGSGKSTLMKVAYGELSPDSGEVEVAGSVRSFRSPHDAIAAGITMVPQEIPSALDLSVTENVLLGALPRRGLNVDWRTARTRAQEVLQRLGVSLDPDAPLRSLSPHDRQLVAIAHALAAGSQVLIFDEPTSSLSLGDAERLFAVMRQLRASGIGVVFITQRLREVTEIADRVTVLRDGHKIGERTGHTSSEEVANLVTGSVFAGTTHTERKSGGAPVLVVSGLSDGGLVRGVGLSVEPGEIVGISGLMGCGRSELFRLLFGAGAPRVEGSISVAGRELTNMSPAKAIRNGMALVTADRRNEGLVLERSIHENLMLTRTRRLSLRLLRRREERRLTDRLVADLGIKVDSIHAEVRTLSGGNQQKVVLGRSLASTPKVLLLDEPTRGIDVGAKADFYRVVTGVADQGVGVVVGSLDNTELLEVCHRILVLREGRVVADLVAAETTESELLLYASGATKGAA